MKILGSSISSHLPHLGLLRLGLFLMIVEAIVEAGLTEKSKQGLFGTNGTGGDNVGESLEDKLRQHLAITANTTRVRVALHHHTIQPPILPFSEILLNPAVQNNQNLNILLRNTKKSVYPQGRSKRSAHYNSGLPCGHGEHWCEQPMMDYPHR